MYGCMYGCICMYGWIDVNIDVSCMYALACVWMHMYGCMDLCTDLFIN